MEFSSYSFTIFFIVLGSRIINGQPLVPALFLFGDSIVDVGNNNNLLTVVKSNFAPYGRDFKNHKATGRFCNGLLATDITAQNLGFTSYPPAYLSPEAQGKNLLYGANFASGSSGYHPSTSKLYNTMSLDKQLDLYAEYQEKIKAIVEEKNASSIISGSVYLVSGGSSDFIQNYYINPLLNLLYSTDQFSDMLLQYYSQFIQSLYKLGARRIGVTTLPPMGCLPAAITLFNKGSNDCNEKMNEVALSFNNKLNTTSQALQKNYKGLKLVILDIYQPLYNIIKNYTTKGFGEARRGCCGTGLLETAILCNPWATGTCANASQYVFWDGFHPTEATNKLLAVELIASGIDLIS